MNLNLLRNKLALALLGIVVGVTAAFSQNDSTKIKVLEDTFVSEQSPTTILNGGDGDLGVAIDEKNGDSRETYLKFDISELSGKGGLVSVALSIEASVKNEAPWLTIPHFYLNIYGCTNSWSESTLTWNNKVASKPEIIAEADIEQAARYEIAGTTVDQESIMKYIEDAMKNHEQFVSFVLKGKQETPKSRIWVSDMGWEPARLIVVQDMYKDEPGAVAVSAESLSIAAANNATTITEDNGTLQMNAIILPVNADIQRVKWSIYNETGKATISPDGLLTAVDNGTVTVVADAIDGSWLQAETRITISGQNFSWKERNIIINGDFSTLEAWYGNINIVDGVGLMAPEQVTPNPWDAGVIEEMKIPYDKKDNNFVFSFQIYAEEPRSMVIMMEDYNNDYTKFGISTDAESTGQSFWTIEHLPLKPTFYNFHVRFPDMAVNCSQHLIFCIGASTATIHLDSVSLMTAEDFASTAPRIHTNNLKVYPNPVGAANELTVSLATENEKVVIYNAMGQKMMEKIASGNLAKFNVSSLKKGIYIVKLNDGTSLKFIK
ncbi:MAG TPA: DNRLRE domain-containing protein [Prolixibacteraceae bacterium]|jgi:hypothetical protein